MKLILVAVFAALLVTGARAQEKAAPAKSNWSDFFKNLKSTLAQSAVSGERKKGRNAQGVAAVRGKKQGNMADPNEPSIKGDVKAAKARREQALNDELAASLELITKGKPEEGLKGLEAFKEAHPKHMPEDVDKAIEGAKAMVADKGAATTSAKE